MGVSIVLAIVMGLVAYFMVMRQIKKRTQHSFLYGFSLSILVYLASSFLFFWFSIFRRMYVLHIPFRFDSEVAFATIIIPMIVAIPWIPLE